MGITNKELYKGTPGTAETTLYTAPAGTTALIKSITICNTTTSSADITIKVGGMTFITTTVSAKDVISFDSLCHTLSVGETITALQGTASAINVFIGGAEVSS